MLQEPTSRLKPRWDSCSMPRRTSTAMAASTRPTSLQVGRSTCSAGCVEDGKPRAEFEASEAGAIATRLAVAAQTADVYVTIRGLQARIAIARQQAETRRQLLSTVMLQYEKGIAAELQVRQAEGSRSEEHTSELQSLRHLVCRL